MQDPLARAISKPARSVRNRFLMRWSSQSQLHAVVLCFFAGALAWGFPLHMIGAEPPEPPSICPGCFRITASSGNGQTGNISSILPSPLVVTVTSASSGAPLPLFLVTFTINGGGNPNGALLSNGTTTQSGVQVVTGPDGTASAILTLGNSPGQYQVTADCPPGPDCIGAIFTETALAAPSRLTITTTSLPAGTAGQPYSAQLAASGGTPPYTWSIASGPLPTGLTLAGTTIAGIPNTAGTFNFTVQAMDAGGGMATQALSIQIANISAPANLRATQPGMIVAPLGDQIILAWDYGSDPIDGFEIDSKTPSGNWIPLTTVLLRNACSPSTNSASPQSCIYIDTTVRSFFTISYRVRAFQGSIKSNDSNVATAYQLQTATLPPVGSVIEAYFTPDPSLPSVQSAATGLPPDDPTLAVQPPKFDHFNWISYVEHDPLSILNGCDINGTVVGQALHAYQPGSPPTQGPAQLAPHLDPPLGGYVEYKYFEQICDYGGVLGACPGPGDELPFYWDENPNPATLQPWYLDTSHNLNPGGALVTGRDSGGDPNLSKTVQFHDQPKDPCLPGNAPNQSSEYFGFFTALVGVRTPNGAAPPDFTPLAAFVWNTTYNAKSGGVNGISLSSSGPPVAGGSGGIFNIATIDISNLPPAIRQQLIQAGAHGVSAAPYIDTSAPMTTSFVSGPKGTNGWYIGTVTVTLTATDIDGPTDILETSYAVDAGSLAAYTSPFAISGDGIHSVEFGSVDRAGNVETPRPNQQVKIDGTPPSTAVTAIASRRREEDDKKVRIVISGSITDSTSGVDPASPAFVVKNEDGTPQIGGPVTIAADGKYSFSISFEPTRRHEHDEEREQKGYQVVVSAKDNAGNQGSSLAFVVDRRERGDHDDEGHPHDHQDE
jgi:hypothetical protein